MFDQNNSTLLVHNRSTRSMGLIPLDQNTEFTPLFEPFRWIFDNETGGIRGAIRDRRAWNIKVFVGGFVHLFRNWLCRLPSDTADFGWTEEWVTAHELWDPKGREPAQTIYRDQFTHLSMPTDPGGKRHNFWFHDGVYCEARNSIIVRVCAFDRDPPIKNPYQFAEISLSTDEWTMWSVDGEHSKWFTSGLHHKMVTAANGQFLFCLTKDLEITVHDLSDHTSKPMVSTLPLRSKVNYRDLFLLIMPDELADEFVAVGFIRTLFAESRMENMQLPPLYIMQMIGKWVGTEHLHLIQKNERTHWRVTIKEILRNATAIELDEDGQGDDGNFAANNSDE